MALFCASFPVSREKKHHDRETEAAKWNSAISDFMVHICAFQTRPNEYYEKELFVKHLAFNVYYISPIWLILTV